jgi:hypothetical protein
MCVSLPVKNFEGIDIPLLICLSYIDLVTETLAKDHLGCLTAGSDSRPYIHSVDLPNAKTSIASSRM